MVDFLEYVIAELKSKRLSHQHAAALVKQFSAKRPSESTASRLHPLLHRNVSTLAEQIYTTVLSGREFFLADHQLRAADGASHCILPGVAYLEMARAAVADAAPELVTGAGLELSDIVWAQPIIVDAPTEVRIALWYAGDRRLEFEIYSVGTAGDTVHCQGVARGGQPSQAAKLDLEGLRARMSEQGRDKSEIYRLFHQVGMLYGSAHQGLESYRVGAGEVLASVRLPEVLDPDTSARFQLHPSLLDSALQAALGLHRGQESKRAMMPFALNRLRIHRVCEAQMIAWLRCDDVAQSQQDSVRFDLDLIAPDGEVCVQMQGVTARGRGRPGASQARLAATAQETEFDDDVAPMDEGLLVATPVRHNTAYPRPLPRVARRVVVWLDDQAGPPAQLQAQLPEVDVLHCNSAGDDPGEVYRRVVLFLHEFLCTLPIDGSAAEILVHVVSCGSNSALSAGLVGLLRTAELEIKGLTTRLLRFGASESVQVIAQHLRDECPGGTASLMGDDEPFGAGRGWKVLTANGADELPPFREFGVYLITGGLGGLGSLLAAHILETYANAVVVIAGRAPLGAEVQAKLRTISSASTRLHYRQLDLTSVRDIRAAVDDIVAERGVITGIFHVAGARADAVLANLTAADFTRVFQPKVQGTYNLDLASRHLKLDFFVLFSSMAGPFGNFGQAAYAAANGFLDVYAAQRHELVGRGLAHGASISINWPLWQNGGMHVDSATIELLYRTMGLRPLPPATGLRALEHIIQLGEPQALVLYGDRARLRQSLIDDAPGAPPRARAVAGAAIEPSLRANVEMFLQLQIASGLKLKREHLDLNAPFEHYGINSILAVGLVSQLETHFGMLPKTLFFEYQTVAELAEYFCHYHAKAVVAALGAPHAKVAAVAPPAPPEATKGLPSRRQRRTAAHANHVPALPVAAAADKIAIIGISGRYPGARDLDAFWSMLRDGIDCISEIPASRWQWRDYFVGEDCPHGSHSSKWGGFIEGVDEFDPRFFNISPREALHIDPQERLFLEHAWQALEDSGYSRAALQIPRAEQLPGQVGVYVGVMYGEYNLSGSLASIANRVSHVLNVHGPSMTLDTMCSSSLTAIHIACEDLRAGRTDMGFAGGVNVSIHPGKYSMLSAGQFISRQGHCQSFGEGADGYIPGEGVGCVLLKRLQDAIADGDHIHAVIAASALNHGGKTNGYTVPNPNAQADVIAMALARAGVDPGAVSYIEAHGTGTKLGDPIEVAALSKTFGLSRSDPQSCIIGSVKSNIGHCESAAGIAGLTKIVLQLKHRQIAASLHSERLNPNIDFSASPFVVNQVLRPWSPTDSDGRPSPRIAGLSSFGAGGANAHFVIEEYVTSSPDCAPSSGSELIVLSAATTAQLMQRARDLLAAVSETTTTLASIAHTLQVGREPMATRLALLVASREDLIAKLELYIRGEPDQLCTYSGHIGTASSLGMLQADPDFESVIARWLADGKWGKVAQLWVSGLDLNWQRCLKRRDVPRASLPGYPFARERYWIDPVRASHASELVAERNASRDRADLGDVAAPHTVAAESRGVALPPLVELLPGQALVRRERMQLAPLVPAAGTVKVQAEQLRTKGSARTAEVAASVYGGERSCLEDELRQSLAEALFLTAAEISPETPFIDVGLDSVVGVEWVRALNRRYRLDMSATRIYDYANLRELAGYIETELDRESPSTPSATVSADATVSPDATLSPDIVPAHAARAAVTAVVSQPAGAPSQSELRQLLIDSLAAALYLPPESIEIDRSFVDLGLDSIVGVEWVKAVNKQFGTEIAATSVYDYANIAAFSEFLRGQLPARAGAEAACAVTPEASPPGPAPAAPDRAGARTMAGAGRQRERDQAPPVNGKIAIVGMSGRYPEAENLQQFWRNLASGRNSIKEVPNFRWDVAQYFDPQQASPDGIYCKWLGALDDIECFDPVFFQISAAEAEVMDPQHRLFMQEAYRAFEDAGYAPRTLANSNCGVYLGIMSCEYSFLLSERGAATASATGNSFAIGAARIAYHLNLKGPAIPVDTACSSSLVAIDLACKALIAGDIDMALAGGVSLYLIADSYIAMCQAGMLARDGQCKTFDEAADGFVPGEGVGAVVLKRLEDAERDGDQIYGVIIGSGVNQDGKTNGITAPSVNSQISLERQVYRRNGIDPESIGYVETHGTGTKLGDPIELEALQTVFVERTTRRQFCALGAVKSNIGHTSGAAGVAGLHKVLLCLRHKALVPSLNINNETPHFDFAKSPFFISRSTQPWHVEGGLRRAAVSSFGFSGTNAHLVIEEYSPPVVTRPLHHGPLLIPISARTEGQLRQRVEDLLAVVMRADATLDLRDLAYTYAIGRDHFAERLALVVADLAELKLALESVLQGSERAGVHVRRSGAPPRSVAGAVVAESEWLTEHWQSRADLERLAEGWLGGAALNWLALYARVPAQRISLPTYPFAKERYWPTQPAARAAAPALHQLQPIWQPRSLPPIIRPQIAPTLLVVDSVFELAEALGAQARQRGLTTSIEWLQVPADNGLTECATNNGRYHSVVEQFAARLTGLVGSTSPITLVQRLGAAGRQTELADVELTQQLLQCWLRLKPMQPLALVSVYIDDTAVATCAHRAFCGFLKAVNLESAALRAKLLALPPNSEVTWRAAAVLDEICTGGGGVVDVRYRTVGSDEVLREVKGFAAPPPRAAGQAASPFKQRGVYLITGGLGGIGFQVAAHLAAQYDARLILLGRSPLDARLKARLRSLAGDADSKALYLQVDIAEAAAVERAMRDGRARYGAIDGVIHCAGLQRDALLVNKTLDDLQAVTAAKVQGTQWLDYFTADDALDFFILFSSVAGVFGNFGQTDYAYANAYLDAFAEYRAGLVARGQRSGHSLSINWPFWRDGGMRLDDEVLRTSELITGIGVLPTEAGLELLTQVAIGSASQVIAVPGDQVKILAFANSSAAALTEADAVVPEPTAAVTPASDRVDSGAANIALNYVIGLVSAQTKLPAERIDSYGRFDDYGLDSIMSNRLLTAMMADLGELPKTLLYQYDSIDQLAGYLAHHHGVKLRRAIAGEGNVDAVSDGPVAAAGEGGVGAAAAPAAPATPVPANSVGAGSLEKIAIIGVHASLPGAATLDEFWKQLRAGRTSIREVPASRWDAAAIYAADRARAVDGKIYHKWGGFLDDVDCFDADLFNIDAGEARLIDPQERLFLQSCWAALEDAGYSREALDSIDRQVGVFVGATTNSYNLLTVDASGAAVGQLPASMSWSIANRVSYFFDLKGPSMPVDTACSSSLVAVHLACEHLRRGECKLAIAGGVNLYLHSNKYLSFCQRGMLANGNECRSFAAGEDGFVPGEAIGALILKPLAAAERDGDHIYGVVAASACNHGGRANGYSAPNPKAQADLIKAVLATGRVLPAEVTYVEGHGTATQLGDNLEVTALHEAFGPASGQYCALGSVKANIGHSESAAGLAGVVKVLLQLKHKTLVPTLYAGMPNPDIDFDRTQFYLNPECKSWDPGPDGFRRALVNAFGAGGVNACVLIEEYHTPAREGAGSRQAPGLVVLSAQSVGQLKQYANQLGLWRSDGGAVSFADICSTLQTGRQHLPIRLAIVATDFTDLRKQIKAWLKGRAAAGTISNTEGAVTMGEGGNASMGTNAGLWDTAARWVRGERIDWSCLAGAEHGRRISLPTYPFKKQRHWVTDPIATLAGTPAVPLAEPDKSLLALHPLIAHNSSTFANICFDSELRTDAYYARDHRIRGTAVLPGASLIEIACFAGSLAGTNQVTRMRDVVWTHPVALDQSRTLKTILKPIGGGIEYEIVSFDEFGETQVHSDGRLYYGGLPNLLESDMVEQRPLPHAPAFAIEEFYQRLGRAGIEYGDSFRVVRDCHMEGDSVSARLELSDYLLREFDDYILHPALIDGAFQCVAELASLDHQEHAYLPYAIEELVIHHSLTPVCQVRVTRANATGRNGELTKYDIRILSLNGRPQLTINGFYLRSLSGHQADRDSGGAAKVSDLQQCTQAPP